MLSKEPILLPVNMKNKMPALNPTNNPMKDCQGKWRTYSLFVEHKQPGFKPMFTLQDERCQDVHSLKELYISYDHAPNNEYDFAILHIGSYVQWQRLLISVLKNRIEEWRAELDARLKSEGIQQLIVMSVHGTDSQRIQASKFLANGDYSPKRGRPSKLERERALQEQNGIDTETRNDAERILKSIPGGRK